MGNTAGRGSMLLVPQTWGKRVWGYRVAKEIGEGGLGATERVGGLQGAWSYHRDGEVDAGIFGTTGLQEGGPGGAGVSQHRERDSGGPQREGKGSWGTMDME